MKFNRFALGSGFLALLVLGSLYFLKSVNQARFESKLRSFQDVAEIEAHTGGPIYVLRQAGGQFGRGIITDEEFIKGFTIRVYVVKKIPPRFLVIKVALDGIKVMRATIETS
jgi:hypothetical protein